MLKSTANYRHNSCGMSLVEVIVVLAIFSVVVMAVMSLYIPVVQSTAVQTQVSDVQGNLRLAMNRITQDILTAGFLVDPNFDSDGTCSTCPEKPGPIYWQVAPHDETVTTEFTIRTRAIGSGFGRVPDGGESFGTDVKLVFSDSAMDGLFPNGCKVRLYEPISTLECDELGGTDEDERVYTVINADFDDGFLVVEDSYGNLSAADVGNETVVIRVKDSNQPALQTIRYKFENGALLRIVNGTSTQILARGLDSATFGYEYSPNGNVKKVDVRLVGETEAVGNSALSSAKTRELETAVTLRNVF